MNAVDTNVLLYSHDFRDPRKQAIASALISSLNSGALIWQVACEFVAASHKLKLKHVVSYDPWDELRGMEAIWAKVTPDWPSLARAESLMTRFSLSHWDSLLIAVCLDKGVACLYSEDFSAYPLIDGMRIVNPFVP
jgi:predicted nucleic acid-binding protein